MLVLKQFISNLVPEIRFFTAYITWSAYFLIIYCFRSLFSWICDRETILIFHERPRILLFIFFRRREVSLDRCLVDWHIILFVVGEDGQGINLHIWICYTVSMILYKLMLCLDTSPHADTDRYISCHIQRLHPLSTIVIIVIISLPFNFIK